MNTIISLLCVFTLFAVLGICTLLISYNRSELKAKFHQLFKGNS